MGPGYLCHQAISFSGIDYAGLNRHYFFTGKCFNDNPAPIKYENIWLCFLQTFIMTKVSHLICYRRFYFVVLVPIKDPQRSVFEMYSPLNIDIQLNSYWGQLWMSICLAPFKVSVITYPCLNLNEALARPIVSANEYISARKHIKIVRFFVRWRQIAYTA